MTDRVSHRRPRPAENRQNSVLPVAAESLVNDERNLIRPRQMVDIQLQRLIESSARITMTAAVTRQQLAPSAVQNINEHEQPGLN